MITRILPNCENFKILLIEVLNNEATIVGEFLRNFTRLKFWIINEENIHETTFNSNFQKIKIFY